MITEGPYSLTLNAVATLPDPTAQYGNPADRVQIQNSSVFVLEILAGGTVYTIQPFVAQTIPTASDGAGLTVVPTQNPSASSASSTLTAVWLLAHEDPPMGDGPLTSAAIIAAIAGTITTQGNATLVGQGTVGSRNSLVIFASNLTPAIPTSTRSLLLLAAADVLKAGTTSVVSITALSAVAKTNFYQATVSIPVANTTALPAIYVPWYGLIDPFAEIFVNTNLAGDSTSTWDYYLLALPDPDIMGSLNFPSYIQTPPGVPIAASLPAGDTSNGATLVLSATNGQLIPAPPAGQRVVLDFLSLVNTTTTAGDIKILSNGNAGTILMWDNQPAAGRAGWPVPGPIYGQDGKNIWASSGGTGAIRLTAAYHLEYVANA